MINAIEQRRHILKVVLLGLWAVALLIPPAAAQTPLGTAFTYQGQLKSNGAPAGGTFNMTFALFDGPALGSQIGPTLVCDGSAGNPPPVTVTNGLFNVTLDFGATAYATNE